IRAHCRRAREAPRHGPGGQAIRVRSVSASAALRECKRNHSGISLRQILRETAGSQTSTAVRESTRELHPRARSIPVPESQVSYKGLRWAGRANREPESKLLPRAPSAPEAKGDRGCSTFQSWPRVRPHSQFRFDVPILRPGLEGRTLASPSDGRLRKQDLRQECQWPPAAGGSKDPSC